MQNLLLIAVPILPVLLAISTTLDRYRHLMLFAPVYAITAALILPVNMSVNLPWLLLGVYLEFDAVARIFMFFSAIIWFVAALTVSRGNGEHPATYRLFFLLAFSGNMLLMLAADMLSFYLGFALMGLSTYVLILKPSQQARRAARVYLGYTLIGELALFSAILIIFNATGSLFFAELRGQPLPPSAIALLLLGFGIKLALPGLHPWLPLTYTAAPIVTAAVLSGPMMKAGLLGWIRFLPPGSEDLVIWGQLLIWLGTAALLLGSILALAQYNARAVLAYSSIAKMGFISFVFGHALANPEQSDMLLSALIFFAMHHLLVKSALFLGLGEYKHSKHTSLFVYAGLVLLAFSLIGLPFSAGSSAKLQLDLASESELGGLLKLSGFATTLILLHFLWLLKPDAIKSRMQTNDIFRKPISVYAWFLLLPVAYWAPFNPVSAQFDSKSLFFIVIAAAAYISLSRVLVLPKILPRIMQPGDVYHLWRRLRFNNPVAIKSGAMAFSGFKPVIRQQEQNAGTGRLSLTIPGLLWMGVLFLVLIFLLVPLL